VRVYVPPRYRVEGEDAWRLIDQAGAGFLVVATDEGMRSVFAPVLVSEDRTRVLAHLARGNGWWRSARNGDEVLGLFRVADTYISPGLYRGKREDPRVAPTWDYDVVEVRGRLAVHDDPAFVEPVVRALTTRHESTREEPWSVDDAPREFTEALLRGIVGIEITVFSITGAAKLSQNKDDVDRAAVIEALASGTDRERAVAERMKDHL
jgi:transcriptional regulator